MPQQIPSHLLGLLVAFPFVVIPTRLTAQAPAPIAPLVASARYTDSLDRAVAQNLSAADREGAELARTALPMLKRAEVKAFAQHLIDDHQAGLTATTIVATRLGYPLTPPEPLAAPPAAGLSVAGEADSQFLASEIAWHRQLLDRLPASGALLRDDGLRLRVVESRQAAQAHLDEANRLQAKMNPSRP